jgi:hypothetical protein
VVRRALDVKRRAIRRARERGAALFIVVLVVTLLLGIGTFAARSANLANAASGSERQMTQARYVAEYAMMFATASLSSSGAQSYMAQLRNPSPADICAGQVAGTPQRSCYKMLYSTIQTQFSGVNLNICEPKNGTTPGSLGMLNAECDFVVEMSDVSEGAILPGFGLSTNSKPLRFWYVTATASGQVRYPNTSGNATLDPTSAEMSSTQTIRGRILAGPFPTL